MMPVQWAEMTGPEVRRFARKTNVALVPVGCVEMHGPHLPTGNDAYVAQNICVAAAQREPAIVLPPIFYNINNMMKGYPGTISMPIATVRQLYADICTECARNRFSRVLFFIGHGGSQIVVDVLEADILERRRNGEKISYDVFWTFITTLMQPELGQLVKTPMGHGCEFETSLTLHCRPDLVKLDRVKKDGPVLPKKIQKTTYRTDWIRQVPEGYIGKPRLATAQKGKQLIDVCVVRLAEIIHQVKRFDPKKDA